MITEGLGYSCIDTHTHACTQIADVKRAEVERNEAQSLEFIVSFENLRIV